MPPTPHLSFAGVNLPLAPSFLEDKWLKVVTDSSRFEAANFWSFDNQSRSLPTPDLPVPPHFRLGVLTWPTGASRPAWFHTLVNTSRLEAIKSAIGSVSTPKPLYFSDGRDGCAVTAQMYALPERPLNNLGDEFSDLWLLTLTDQRFYWYWKRGAVTQPTSHADLYAQLATILGVTVTVETVDSAYGTPSAKWVSSYTRNTPVVLDAAAEQCGQRVVVGLDGSVKTVNWETARAASGDYVESRPTVIAGGFVPEASIGRYVPASVNVLFVDTSSSLVTTTPHVVNKTLTELAVTQYGSASGVASTAAAVPADIPYTGSNTSAVNSYATAAAEDWYGWSLPDTDLVYGGVEAWEPTGWEDVCEWTLKLVRENPQLVTDKVHLDAHGLRTGYDDPFASTAIRRGPWLDLPSGDFLTGLTPIPCDWIPGGCPSAGSGSGSGSGGSGSGSGCGVTTLPVEFACSNGVRTVTVKEIAVGIENNQLVIQECGEEETTLGPCSPTNPAGTTVPVATKVCPVTEVINYLDWDSNPQSKTVVTAIRVERTLVTVPVADPAGCITFTDCCSGSGSGSGGGCEAECLVFCDQCQTGMSTSWTLYVTGEDPIQLCRVEDPDDGNYCRFVSGGGRWELKYEYGDDMWVLTDLDNADVWAVAGANFQCRAENVLVNADGLDDAAIDPDADCSGGGTIPTDCCPDDLIPATLTVAVTDKTGDCTCLPDSFELTYTGGQWVGSILVCGVFTMQPRLACNPGGASWNFSSNQGCMFNKASAVWECNPFSVVFSNATITNCCTGTATFTIS